MNEPILRVNLEESMCVTMNCKTVLPRMAIWYYIIANMVAYLDITNKTYLKNDNFFWRNASAKIKERSPLITDKRSWEQNHIQWAICVRNLLDSQKTNYWITKNAAWRIIKEILLEIGFIQDMRTTWCNREVPLGPNLFPQFPLFAKIRFNPFDSVPLAILHFTIVWHC